MNLDIHKSALESLRSRIIDISTDLSRGYSELISNIYSMGDEVNRISKDLKKTADSIYSLENGDFIFTLINSLDSNFKQKAPFFDTNNIQLVTYAKKIQEDIKELSKLDDTILLMQETAIDMEIISINTLTVAVRAGKVGGAFSYITNEIKKLTQAMSSHADLLDSRAKLVHGSLENCGNKLEIILEKESIIKENMQEVFSKQAQEGLGKIKDLYMKLVNLTNDLKKVNTLISQMVQKLQFQDTVAQALDNINTVIFKYIHNNAINDSKNKEDILNYLLLRENIYRTAEGIIGDIKLRSLENLESFQEVLKEMENSYKDISTKKDIFSEGVRNSNFFSSPLVCLRGILEEVNETFSLKTDFARSSQSQSKIILSLRQIFEGISLIISRFENISIASKIEVAKQKGLKGMEGNIREMTSLIDRISKDLSEGKDIIFRFTNSIEQVISQYSKNYYHDEKIYRELQDNINSFLVKMEHHFDSTYIKIKDFSFFQNMNTILPNIYSQISILRSLVPDLDDIKFSLAGFYVEAKEDLERALRDYGLSSWEFTSANYADALDHFKIHSYKMAMRETLGKDVVNDAVDEGDVILF